MDPHGVHVLHIADGDAVVDRIADDFVFDFFPSGEIFFDKHLWRFDEGGFEKLREFCFVCDASTTLSAQSKSRTYNQRKTNFPCCCARFVDGDSGAGDGNMYTDRLKFSIEERAIFGLADSFNRCPKDTYIVHLENTFLFYRETAIECCLPPKTEG